MQDKPSGAGDERATTTAEQDLRDQAAVLRHVLSLFPETLTLDELVREMIGVSPSQSSERDAVERPSATWRRSVCSMKKAAASSQREPP
jgi:hypothetical protein